jgi:methylmalonyl-CoA/ethylmalonyl-CoA epimerase
MLSSNEGTWMPEFHHIGYAVQSINAYLEQFVLPLLKPLTVGNIVEDPIQKVRVVFVTLKGGGTLELIEPTTPDSPVMPILRRNRGGIYHVCYTVTSLEESLGAFVRQGGHVITGPDPATAFSGRQIAFVCTPFGDLIELVERTRS